MAFETSPSSTQSSGDRLYAEGMEAHFGSSAGSCLDKLRNFPRFVPRQSLATFLAKHEIFRRIVGIHGSIIECGVFMGGGLFTWAQLSSIYEPVNHTRRVIGFDSFRGFLSLAPHDRPEESPHPDIPKRAGTYCFGHQDELVESCRLHDLNRPVGHIPKVELVAGDAVETIPQYLAANPHLVVALLYLDFDLYEPTKAAISTFVDRMPKGAVIAFDELNQKLWPGETLAVLETIGIRNVRVERTPFSPQISFAVLE
jgi:hypothetical protein